MNTHTQIKPRAIPVYRDRGAPDLIPSEILLASICKAMDRVAKADMKAALKAGAIAKSGVSQAPREADTMMPATTSLEVAELAALGSVDIDTLPEKVGVSAGNMKSCLKYMVTRRIVRRIGKKIYITVEGLEWLAAQRELAKSEGGRVTMLRAVVNGYATSSELVDVMQRSKPTINRIAVALVSEGLLSRERFDGRTNLPQRMSITEAGWAYLEARK